jgi:NADPH:quinone reductase-like Zn-dependent oxidoreductase
MTSPQQSPASSVEAHCVRLLTKAADVDSILPVIEPHRLSRGESDVLIEVKAAAVNPSDVKAAIGMMPYAVFPRTPGRDFAGRVIEGPANLIGREVFGSSGDLGIRRDGTHATHLVVEADAVVEKPASHWKRLPGSACHSSPRWKVFVAPGCRCPARRC